LTVQYRTDSPHAFLQKPWNDDELLRERSDGTSAAAPFVL
jgi:hypothetical protein